MRYFLNAFLLNNYAYLNYMFLYKSTTFPQLHDVLIIIIKGKY